MNNQPNQSDQNNQQNYDINRSIVNPLLQSMDSCPYYKLKDQKEPTNQTIEVKPKQQLNDVNPYYPAYNSQQQRNPSYEQAPVFQNTPQIQIKKKEKKPKKSKKKQQSLRQQEYIKLNNDGKGGYQRQQGSKSQSDCCDQQCCNEACIQVCIRCICEVGIMIICQAIFKK